LNVRLALLSRTLSPGENLHDFVGPCLPYSLLDTVVWLARMTSAGGMPLVVNFIDYNASPVESSSSWFMQRVRVLRL
jgi:hypothetical protein